MANNFDRTPRTVETREKTATQASWRPASDLPIPAPQDGYRFHWKRAALMGVADPSNIAKARREGWEPCKASDHPELVLDFAAHGVTGSGLIEIGGLVLCKTTVENDVARQKYYEQLTQQHTLAVENNFMRESDPRMPLFKEGESRVKFGPA